MIPARTVLFFLTLLVAFTGCSSKPYPGPDKQGSGTLFGAASGAGSGAILGAQLGSGTGPGALAGAGLGAVAGGIRGAFQDLSEESLLELSADMRRERRLSVAHEALNDHYRRRLELHPSRDIYPADLFFDGDEVELRPAAADIVKVISELNKRRLSWSRLVVAAYAVSKNQDSSYAQHLVERRSKEICDYMVRSGIEPRRLVARGVIVDQPLLIDPSDSPERYGQAIEIIPVDK